MAKTYSLLAYHAKTLSNKLNSMLFTSNNLLYQKTQSTNAIDHFAKKLFFSELYMTNLKLKNIPKKIDTTIKEKSLLIIIGDFLEDIDMSSLNKKHELFIIIIRDTFEQNPTILGDIKVQDPATGEKSNFNFNKSARDAYKKSYLENDKKLYKHLNSIKATFIKILTDEDIYKKLYL